MITHLFTAGCVSFPKAIRVLSLIAAFLASALLVAELRGDVSLPPVFGDHMVLQQGATIPVWGEAAPGERVTVRFVGRYAETLADASGRWRVTLRPVPASFTPEILTVRGEKNMLEIRDVLVGDVWLAAGEGNMEQSLSSGADSAMAGGKDEALRFFKVGHDAGIRPKRIASGSWVSCAPSSIGDLSAVAYFFARDLRSVRRVPLGIIQCTWSGTPLRSWISLRGLGAPPSFPEALALHAAAESKKRDGDLRLIPSSVFNGMIAPLAPYAITGVIWYQGESDEGKAALEYRRLFPRLIRDWRRVWGEGPIPFYFVSLAGFGSADGSPVEAFRGGDGTPGRAWPWIREGMTSALALPFTGMAVASDLGEPDDRYPGRKLEVGRRLALLARHRFYGENLPDSGPLFRSMKIEGRKVRVEFDHAGSGLTAGVASLRLRDAPATLMPTLQGFALSGSDRKWFPATARIEGDAVVLSSDAVPRPMAVRYNWKGSTPGNLFNREGLPAPPFRSDTYPPE